MHARTRTHTHTYMHTYMQTYIHTHIHTCIHPYIHTYMHAHIHTRVRTHSSTTTICQTNRTAVHSGKKVHSSYVRAFNTGSVPARTSHTSMSRSSATDANTDEPSADSGLNETSPTQPAHIQQQSHVGVLKLLCINISEQSVCAHSKDCRCRARVTLARSPCRAHVACVACLRLRQSFSRTLLL
jgi:hypothetical protein